MMSKGKTYLLVGIGVAAVAGAILASQAQKQAGTSAGPAKSGSATATPAKAAAAPASAIAAGDPVLQDKVIKYVRDRFGLPSTVKVTADAFKPSIHPSFSETTIYTDDGKKKSPNVIFVTKDQRLLVIGKLVAVTGDPKANLIEALRQQFKVPATASVTATNFRPSSSPDLSVTNVTITEAGKPSEAQEFFMTRDGRVLVIGAIYDLATDPRKSALQTINLANQPRLGPVTAPVVIVEYSDLQCPTCARMHDFIETAVLKKYAGKVQIIFKEFPLTHIHDWSLTASIANQCVYQISPSNFVPFRSLIFKSQLATNAGNVRELMLTHGEQLGVDRLRLAGCIDSKASLARVEANFVEGKSVGVQSTPTTFVNGKMVVGMPEAEAFHKEVDAALQGMKPAGAKRSSAAQN